MEVGESLNETELDSLKTQSGRKRKRQSEDDEIGLKTNNGPKVGEDPGGTKRGRKRRPDNSKGKKTNEKLRDSKK